MSGDFTAPFGAHFGAHLSDQVGGDASQAAPMACPSPKRNAPHFAGRLGVQGGENRRRPHGQAGYGLSMRFTAARNRWKPPQRGADWRTTGAPRPRKGKDRFVAPPSRRSSTRTSRPGGPTCSDESRLQTQVPTPPDRLDGLPLRSGCGDVWATTGPRPDWLRGRGVRAVPPRFFDAAMLVIDPEGPAVAVIPSPSGQRFKKTHPLLG